MGSDCIVTHCQGLLCIPSLFLSHLFSCVSALISEGAELLPLVINLKSAFFFLLSKLSVGLVLTYMRSCLQGDRNYIFTRSQAGQLNPSCTHF